MRRVLVLGATSSIARSIAGRLCTHGDSVFLAARSSAELERIASDLSIRYGKSMGTAAFEATDFQGHRDLVSRARKEMGGLDGVVCALGMLGDQPEDSWKATSARTLVDVNLTAAVSLISLAVEVMTPGPEAFIVGLSSVAGNAGDKATTSMAQPRVVSRSSWMDFAIASRKKGSGFTRRSSVSWIQR